jgi:hypothetical protein
MGFREDLSRKIERKRAEIAEMDTNLRLAREYLQALEDTFKLLPKDANGGESLSTMLRPGSSLAKARDVLRKTGKPMHLTELLTALGKGHSRNERAALSGTLAAYVRRGEIFTRPAPNTFGLLEMKQTSASEDQPVPPADFGKM